MWGWAGGASSAPPYVSDPWRLARVLVEEKQHHNDSIFSSSPDSATSTTAFQSPRWEKKQLEDCEEPSNKSLTSASTEQNIWWGDCGQPHVPTGASAAGRSLKLKLVPIQTPRSFGLLLGRTLQLIQDCQHLLEGIIGRPIKIRFPLLVPAEDTSRRKRPPSLYSAATCSYRNLLCDSKQTDT